ncbi:FG-GAP and VCBS repeat-containing protein [Streptomyces luteolus]|uniref:FG-GAP and VCBS repeat-containing protein n=1 Tax=Streptomyces luteolus TaxID=3043615 RepID=A0ABT6SRZ9_9ACTN|nr:FG-GAP and VCBS repeat-containing protein [Streptomyces sp. B-S-A12]MDI3418380.1 FG-GAP and VCBS repeat-containing protein [Streptomyces sp. B-S-A12]
MRDLGSVIQAAAAARTGTARTIALLAATVAAAVVATLVWWGVGDAGPEKASAASASAAWPDFDGDGYADLVSPAASDDRVEVSYGARGDGRRQVIRQDVTSAPQRDGDGIGFARHTATADLNDDGHTDLVADVQVVEEQDETGAKSGLLVLWGSRDGLSADAGAGTYLHHVPDDFSIGDGTSDHTLVAGDFDGDGSDDLVVRASGEKALLKGPFSRDGKAADTDRVPRAGAGTGFSGAYAADMNGDGADDLISVEQSDDGIGGGGKYTAYVPGGSGGLGDPETSVLPGIANAAVGDVDNDGFADLVLRRHPEGAAADSAVSGPVEVFYGSKDGPLPQSEGGRHTEIDRDTEGVPGRGKEGSEFGAALAVGDVDGDGRDDVAVGHPGAARTGKKLPGQHDAKQKGAGAVVLLKGGEEGLSGQGAQLVDQATGGKRDAPETKDGFGEAVRLVDTDRDGHADLAAGAPGEDEDTGEVRVLHGTDDGLTGKDARSLTPEDFSGKGGNGADDEADGSSDNTGPSRSGSTGDAPTGPAGTAAEADFDDDGHADLALDGSRGDAGSEPEAGYAAVQYGADGAEPAGRPARPDHAGRRGSAGRSGGGRGLRRAATRPRLRR